MRQNQGVSALIHPHKKKKTNSKRLYARYLEIVVCLPQRSSKRDEVVDDQYKQDEQGDHNAG